MALSIPFSSNSHVSSFCLLIFVLIYLKGAPIYGAKREDDKPYHVLNVKSLDPIPYCMESTKDESKRESLKLVHLHGPCYHMNEDQTSGRKKTNLEDSKPTLPAKSGNWINTGNYVVTLGLGTPKRDLTLIFDTGSDFTWIRCQPCQSSQRCEDPIEPIFNLSASTTYRNISCPSPRCSEDLKFLKHNCSTTNTCEYNVGFYDETFTIGLYGTETITLSPSDVITEFAFGCGLNNSGLFGRAAGFLGLGRNSASFVEQTASKYGKYFSYCLPTLSSSGTLVFGKDGATTTNSANIKYTSLSTNPDCPACYLIQVTGIKVAGEFLRVAPSVFSSPGTIIDSGTDITQLQLEVYKALKMRFRQLMMNYTMINQDEEPLFDTCYDFTGHDMIQVPNISFFFAGNIEVPIALEGTLVNVDKLKCLAFTAVTNPTELATIGNVQQQTLKVVYDVAHEKIGFGTGGCS